MQSLDDSVAFAAPLLPVFSSAAFFYFLCSSCTYVMPFRALLSPPFSLLFRSFFLFSQPTPQARLPLFVDAARAPFFLLLQQPFSRTSHHLELPTQSTGSPRKSHSLDSSYNKSSYVTLGLRLADFRADLFFDVLYLSSYIFRNPSCHSSLYTD